MSLTFQEASERVDAFIGQFEEGYFPPLLMLARLTEETGEIARVIAHQNGKTPKAGEDAGDLEMELADLLFVMLCMANERGLNLERGFARMMDKIDRRDADRWTKKTPDGQAEGQSALARDLPRLPGDPALTDARYPLGPMPLVQSLTPAQRNEARRAVADLPAALRAAVQDLTDAQLDTPYREGGWTVRQVVHHVADSHLNAFVRLKLALTEPNPTIKPYDEALWAQLPDTHLPVGVSLDLLSALHTRLGVLLDSVTDWTRPWTHPATGQTWTVDSLLAMYAWHGQHHTAHITALRAQRGW